MDLNLGISIIVPTYNEAGTIKVLLRRLFSPQKGKKVEVIIVDANKSNDNISKAASNFPIQYIQSRHTCRAIQLNQGAQCAKHDVLYFVHADAIPPINFVSQINQSINQGNDFGYFRFEFDSKNPFLKINSYMSQFKGFYTGGGDQSFYIKKSLFNKLDGFNEELKLCEDFDLYDRLKMLGNKHEIINSKLIISSRKYDYANYFKINYANFYVLRNFRKGVSTELLKVKYEQMIGKESK